MSKEEIKQPAPQNQTITMTQKDLQDMVTMSSMAAAETIAKALRGPVESSEDREKRIAKDQQCRECGQLRRACKDLHRTTIVFPISPSRERWFQGVIINGVTYRSDYAGQPIIVPLHSNVEYMVAKWEENEEALITGRKSQHNSGVISQANRAGFRAAAGGWR